MNRRENGVRDPAHDSRTDALLAEPSKTATRPRPPHHEPKPVPPPERRPIGPDKPDEGPDDVQDGGGDSDGSKPKPGQLLMEPLL